MSGDDHRLDRVSASHAARERQRRGFVAIATFVDDWWSIEVPQLPGVVAHASDAGNAEAAIRDAILQALTLGPEEFNIRVIFIGPDEVSATG